MSDACSPTWQFNCEYGKRYIVMPQRHNRPLFMCITVANCAQSDSVRDAQTLARISNESAFPEVQYRYTVNILEPVMPSRSSTIHPVCERTRFNCDYAGRQKMQWINYFPIRSVAPLFGYVINFAIDHRQRNHSTICPNAKSHIFDNAHTHTQRDLDTSPLRLCPFSMVVRISLSLSLTFSTK